jgi:aminopeptidase YwaD
MTAKRLGARAVILAQHPRDLGSPLLAFDPSQGARSGLAVVTVGATLAEELLPGFTAAVLRVDRDTSAEAAEQHPLTSQGPRLDAELVVLGDVVREKGNATNVLARLPGGGGPVVVVGAHYDHLGRGGPGSLDPNGVGLIHNGADDNASGTAVVLELARLLSAGPRPEGDVLFALWSGEEMGLLGSAHWCAAPTVPLTDVSANLNLDMVGRAGNGRCEVLGAGTSPAFAEWMSAAGESSGLELQVSLSGQGLGGSDHQSFLNHQVPALHLFTGLHSDYHKPTDDTERFEADGAARVTSLALDLVGRMQAEAELAYVAPKVDENAAPERNRGGMRVRFGSVPVYSYDGEGMLISGTSPNSPAERAGLLAGDVILRIGDIDVDSVRAFAYALKVYKPGDVVKTIYRRDGVEESVLVTLESREAQ